MARTVKKPKPEIDVVQTAVITSDGAEWNLCVPLSLMANTKEISPAVLSVVDEIISHEIGWVISEIDQRMVIVWDECECCGEPEIMALIWNEEGEEFLRLMVSRFGQWNDIQMMIAALREDLSALFDLYVKPMPHVDLAQFSGASPSKDRGKGKEAYAAVILLLDWVEEVQLEKFEDLILRVHALKENEDGEETRKRFIRLKGRNDGGCDA